MKITDFEFDTQPLFPASWKPDTIVLHTGYDGSQHQRSAAVPIYQTTSFIFEDARQGADLFGLLEEGHVYARTGNPTQAVLEERIRLLEGGTAAVAVASGMAAIDSALATLAQAGDHVIVASDLYGGSHNLIVNVLHGRGVTATVLPRDRYDTLTDAITPRTKAVFIESLSNPAGQLADIRKIADQAHAHGVAVVVDNTVATPLLIRPIEHGADIVVHSATKYIGGHGVVMGGIVVDSGRFNWTIHADRYPQFNQPDPAFQNIVFVDQYPQFPFAARVRTVLLRNGGASLPAHSAFLLLLGLETLSLRIDRISSNTQAIVHFLASHPLVEQVSHISRPDHPDHALANTYLPDQRVPGLLSFSLRGGQPAARVFHDALKVFLRLVNVGDSKSLATIPAETTHRLLDDAARARAGITSGLVRLSIGTEHPDDLIADLALALQKSALNVTLA
ncbi:MAG: O-acetylhomoserine aminocarboxypropyltransferase/cysteine synthase [Alcaligenaceae bacterium]|nr:O-acetylhomoserine aminocarboxypropyltransferase/cysteine synthase [Alcaligenaceae bacterium]